MNCLFCSKKKKSDEKYVCKNNYLAILSCVVLSSGFHGKSAREVTQINLNWKVYTDNDFTRGA